MNAPREDRRTRPVGRPARGSGNSSGTGRGRWAGSDRADLQSRTVLGLGFLVVAVGLAVFSGPLTDGQVPAERIPGEHWLGLLLLIAVYAIAYRTVFQHIASGSVPTEPPLVAMLFLLPVTVVPLAVIVAQLIAEPIRLRDGRWRRVVAVRLCSGWHAIGPVLVFLIAEPGPADLADWPIYGAALLAQFVFDIGTSLIREYALGRRLTVLVRPMCWSVCLDTLLAVLGLLAVLAADGSLLTVALVCVPVALTALLLLDRRELAASRENLGRAIRDAREEARVDPLTGVGNRRAWREGVERTDHLLAAEPEWSAGVVFVDMDNLKFANDTRGHEVGDQMLVALATAARRAIRDGDLLCRTGGDEFAILVSGPANSLQLADLPERLQHELDAWPPIAGLRLSAAIGAAECSPGGTVGDAMRVADMAVFEDKRLRRVSRSAGHIPAQRSDSIDLPPPG
jgi:diguanylate cyclase (GGDEF)-like protein